MDPKELRGLYEAYNEVYAPQENLDEAVKGESSERRVDLAAERRGGNRPLSKKEGENYASHKLAQMAYVKRKRMGEELDLFDVVLEFLQVGGYAETLEEAEWMMANIIDEEAIDIILGEEQLDEISKELSGRVVNARIARTGRAFDKEMKDRTPENMRATMDAADKETRAKRLAAGVRTRRNATNEEYMDEAEIMRHQRERDRIEGNKAREAKRVKNARSAYGKKPMYSPPTKGVHGEIERRQAQRPPSRLRSGSLPEEYMDEAIYSEKGKAKAAEMIAARSTPSGRAKSGKGANVSQIRQIRGSGRGSFDREGLGGTPMTPTMAKNPIKKQNYIGTGNRAARRAGTYQEQFELWINSLVEEGYDLSDYTWNEMYEIYLDEAQVANRDPDKYEADQKKKYAPVRGERTPMPPRGNKRREDFEKWYAANVR